MDGKQYADELVRQAWEMVDRATTFLREAEREYQQVGEAQFKLHSRNTAKILEAVQIEEFERRLGVEVPRMRV